MTVSWKATASGFNQIPSSGLTPCTWTSLSVLCWEFLEQTLVFNQSLFFSCRTLSTHISKALTKFLGLHIFLTPNEKQPGWSCEYCPCYCDFQVSGYGIAAPGALGSIRAGAAQAVRNVPVTGAELSPAPCTWKSDVCWLTLTSWRSKGAAWAELEPWDRGWTAGGQGGSSCAWPGLAGAQES